MDIPISHTKGVLSSGDAWDEALLERVRSLASTLSFATLAIVWLRERQAAGASEETVRQLMRDLSHFSHQELVDLIHELGPGAGERILKEFGE
ncbi:MAG: hypothetical protein QY311_00610 [Candidatus Paceibacterota bacterium]|nr:MAG: hypothetical protein QY311_00610 [Candidatus Paceibacterota bacterium]